MRRRLRDAVPSMFQRRLLLLVALAGGVVFMLSVQSVRLTTGAAHRRAVEAAEGALFRTRYIPSRRGRILDRNGRVLAHDQPGFDVAVSFDVIVDEWVRDQAYRAAVRGNRSKWGELDRDERLALIAAHEEPFRKQAALLWRTLGALGRVDEDYLQRRRDEIRRSVQNVASEHWQRLRKRRERELEGEVMLAEVLQPVAEQRQAHVILTDVDERAVNLVRGFIAEAERDDALKIWNEVELRKQMHRRYPAESHRVTVDRSTLPTPLAEDEPLEVEVEGIGLHILGLMRDVWWEDIQKRPFIDRDAQGRRMVMLDGYRDGDRTGRFGIEQSMERRLRGTRGKVIRNISTGREQRVEPRQGRDVALTIDIDLQASLAALLEPQIGLTKAQVWHGSPQVTDLKTPKLGEALNGAAVVMDVATGQILAAVSNPRMSYELLREEPEKIYEDELNRPYFNRPFQQAYQPGSTIKPIVLCSAVAAKRYGLGEKIFCRGYLDEGHPNRYRCWIFKKYLTGHGALGPGESIARSCNVFYYELGQRMGSKRVVEWFGKFGLGSPTGCGLLEETGGDLPDIARADERGAPGFTRADAIFMGIGQGPVRWTPVQAASAYATLARGGRYLPPTLIRDADRLEPRVGRDLNLHPVAVQEALQGLYDVVHASYGTGHYLHKLNKEPIFNVENVTIYGKSGTAQGVPLRAVTKYDDEGLPVEYGPILREGDHSWFIAMVKPEGERQPTHVITVVTEYGGSGAQVSGPIANQIIHLLQQQGYLE